MSQSPKKTGQLKQYAILIRPYQWVKNLLLFSPVFFSGRIDRQNLMLVLWAAICFCLTSSVGYIINDWIDRERDRYHHEKLKRPFCSGTVNGMEALILSGLLICSVCGIIYWQELNVSFTSILIIYFFLTTSYSIYIKQVVILELFAVSMGFVLRVLSGGAVSGIDISSWLFLTVFFISMLISVAKRLSEYHILGEEDAVLHRKSQIGYTRSYLQNVLWVCGGVTLVVYALYVVDHGGVIMYSVLPASYGILRFIYLTEQGRGCDPIKALFSDRQLMLTSLFFFVFLTVMIYV